jgi:hypothetical protein
MFDMVKLERIYTPLEPIPMHRDPFGFDRAAAFDYGHCIALLCWQPACPVVAS